MGKLALAAKVTHVPSLYLSELDGPHKGCRQPAIDGHHEIGRRCRELGVDTIVVFDVHWLVNSEYHINCAPKFEGVYTSNELPHFIKNMPYAYPGNVGLGDLIAEVANEMGVKSRAHSETTLELEYGTLVPMRYMNSDQHFKTVSVAGWCMWHDLETSARFGLAVRKAIEERYDGTVAILASGSLSHHFANNGTAEQFMHKVWNPFLEQMDRKVIELWKQATGKPSAKCCRSITRNAGAKAACTTPRCCLARSVGIVTTARSKSSRRISAVRALARSMRSSP